jgi:hypothetical protein
MYFKTRNNIHEDSELLLNIYLHMLSFCTTAVSSGLAAKMTLTQV